MTIRERLAQGGIRRLRSGRAFRYVHADGHRASAHDTERCRGLRIPPAWRDVAIASRPQARVQAIGRDAAGRWQYLYHPQHVRHQEQEKFRRVLRFGAALPRMRRAVNQHLRLEGLPRQKVMAAIVRILSLSFIRPGSEVYAAENGSFGIATLRRKHTTVVGATVRFDFRGKSGQRQQIECRDPRVARIVKALLPLPGFEVFKFIGDDGQVVDVRALHINAYIKEIAGERFTAKDFRTWAGTLVCAVALARAGFESEHSVRERKHTVTAAIKETAEALGNTPAVCRTSYVYPGIVTRYHRGEVLQTCAKSVDDLRRAPSRCERALLRFLRAELRRL